jgi:8-oxo-dGTP pyrophosphatase MutT (NUDIX family)
MLSKILKEYLRLFPSDRKSLSLLLEQLENQEDLRDRTNYTAHITGSAIIISPDRKRLLQVYHPTHKAWLQPGGHWDSPEKGPWLSAKREAEEETGVKITHQISLNGNSHLPLYIKSHLIPTTPPKNEPEHYHHDFKYGFVAESEDLTLEDEVIKEAKWFEFKDIEAESVKAALDRMLTLIET